MAPRVISRVDSRVEPPDTDAVASILACGAAATADVASLRRRLKLGTRGDEQYVSGVAPVAIVSATKAISFFNSFILALKKACARVHREANFPEDARSRTPRTFRRSPFPLL